MITFNDEELEKLLKDKERIETRIEERTEELRKLGAFEGVAA